MYMTATYTDFSLIPSNVYKVISYSKGTGMTVVQIQAQVIAKVKAAVLAQTPQVYDVPLADKFDWTLTGNNVKVKLVEIGNSNNGLTCKITPANTGWTDGCSTDFKDIKTLDFNTGITGYTDTQNATYVNANYTKFTNQVGDFTVVGNKIVAVMDGKICIGSYTTTPVLTFDTNGYYTRTWTPSPGPTPALTATNKDSFLSAVSKTLETDDNKRLLYTWDINTDTGAISKTFKIGTYPYTNGNVNGWAYFGCENGVANGKLRLMHNYIYIKHRESGLFLDANVGGQPSFKTGNNSESQRWQYKNGRLFNTVDGNTRYLIWGHDGYYNNNNQNPKLSMKAFDPNATTGETAKLSEWGDFWEYTNEYKFRAITSSASIDIGTNSYMAMVENSGSPNITYSDTEAEAILRIDFLGHRIIDIIGVSDLTLDEYSTAVQTNLAVNVKYSNISYTKYIAPKPTLPAGTTYKEVPGTHSLSIVSATITDISGSCSGTELIWGPLEKYNGVLSVKFSRGILLPTGAVADLAALSVLAIPDEVERALYTMYNASGYLRQVPKSSVPTFDHLDTNWALSLNPVIADDGTVEVSKTFAIPDAKYKITIEDLQKYLNTIYPNSLRVRINGNAVPKATIVNTSTNPIGAIATNANEYKVTARVIADDYTVTLENFTSTSTCS